MSQAQEIADQIIAVVERTVAREITIEDSSLQTFTLWGQARQAGIEKEVDAILQASSIKEMEEAMTRLEEEEEDASEDDSEEGYWDGQAGMEDDDLSEFATPGGNSALRAASPSNPRNLPCPSCGEPNRLTPADKARGYQCDSCADQAERGGY
jgi:hypothetical protein